MSLWTVWACAKPLNQIVVFGDSLSDRGNLYEYMNHQLPMSPPYYQGRFTNGRLWIELLASKYYPKNLEEHFLDYAYGGANVGIENHITEFSVQNQIKKYFNEHPSLNTDALFVVWAGANNYLDLPDNIDLTISQVISGLRDSLEELIQHGAKNLFVVNIPDLSTTPAAQEFESEAELKYMSDQHNQKLSDLIHELQRKHPKVQFVTFDITGIMGDIIKNPSNYGFKDGHHTCCEYIHDNSQALSQYPEVLPSKLLASVDKLAFAPIKSSDVCYDYLFFDLYHPTAHAHALMADEIYALFKKNNIDFED